MGDRAANRIAPNRTAPADPAMPDTPAPAWRKSHRCTPDQQCVEVAPIAGEVAVRDSTNPEGPRIHLRAGAWKDFVGRVKTGRFDLV